MASVVVWTSRLILIGLLALAGLYSLLSVLDRCAGLPLERYYSTQAIVLVHFGTFIADCALVGLLLVVLVKPAFRSPYVACGFVAVAAAAPFAEMAAARAFYTGEFFDYIPWRALANGGPAGATIIVTLSVVHWASFRRARCRGYHSRSQNHG